MMEFFSHPVVAIILLLGILVFVHELGHFLVGKWLGMYPEQFSLGFGPAIIEKEINGTKYRLGAIPLGGYVKFYGSTPSEPVPDFAEGREEYKFHPFKRSLMILAGPVANFLLTFVAYLLLGYVGIEAIPAKIGEVLKGSPAEIAGFQYGDHVKKINDTPISTWRELQTEIIKSPNLSLNVEIIRDQKEMNILVSPKEIKTKDIPLRDSKGQLGISPASIPSVITVTDKSTKAYQLGLRTGDRISKLSLPSQSPYSVMYWHDLENFQNGLLKSTQGESVALTIEITRKKSDPKEKPEIFTFQNEISPQNFSYQKLGIYSSQLTVKSWKKEFSSTFLKEDRIVEFEGSPVASIFELQDHLILNKKPEVQISVDREGQKKVLSVKLEPVDVQKIEGKDTYFSLPIIFLGSLERFPSINVQFSNIANLVKYAAKETTSQIIMITEALVGLVTGKMPLAALGGPISIAVVATESVKHGWITFVTAIAIISVNLGLLNLFPIPALDGGRLVIALAEGVMKKPLSEKAMENFQKIGFAMVFSLIIIATYNDVSRFWSTLVKGLSGT